jgi:hypothetical protein
MVGGVRRSQRRGHPPVGDFRRADRLPDQAQPRRHPDHAPRQLWGRYLPPTMWPETPAELIRLQRERANRRPTPGADAGHGSPPRRAMVVRPAVWASMRKRSLSVDSMEQTMEQTRRPLGTGAVTTRRRSVQPGSSLAHPAKDRRQTPRTPQPGVSIWPEPFAQPDYEQCLPVPRRG